VRHSGSLIAPVAVSFPKAETCGSQAGSARLLALRYSLKAATALRCKDILHTIIRRTATPWRGRIDLIAWIRCIVKMAGPMDRSFFLYANLNDSWTWKSFPNFDDSKAKAQGCRRAVVSQSFQPRCDVAPKTWQRHA
jgi:hypothetical protein